jgi:hypothetical protein
VNLDLDANLLVSTYILTSALLAASLAQSTNTHPLLFSKHIRRSPQIWSTFPPSSSTMATRCRKSVSGCGRLITTHVRIRSMRLSRLDTDSLTERAVCICSCSSSSNASSIAGQYRTGYVKALPSHLPRQVIDSSTLHPCEPTFYWLSA